MISPEGSVPELVSQIEQGITQIARDESTREFRLPLLGGRDYPISGAVKLTIVKCPSERLVSVDSRYEGEHFHDWATLWLEKGQEPRIIAVRIPFALNTDWMLELRDKMQRKPKGDPISYSQLLAFSQMLGYVA